MLLLLQDFFFFSLFLPPVLFFSFSSSVFFFLVLFIVFLFKLSIDVYQHSASDSNNVIHMLHYPLDETYFLFSLWSTQFLKYEKKKWRKKKLTIYKVHSHLYCLHLLFNFYLYLVVKYVDLFPVSFFQTSKYSYVQYLHNYCPFFFLLLTSYTFLLKSVPIRLFLSRTNIQLILETGHCKIISRYFLFHLSRQLQRNNFFFKKNFQHHIL